MTKRALLSLCVVITACGSTKFPHVTSSPATSTTAVPATSASLPTVTASPPTSGRIFTPTSTPPSSSSRSAASTVTLSEGDNGKWVSVSRGATLTLVLHSTYWQVNGSSDGSVLEPDGQPVTSGQPPGSGCVPGGGCGTVTAQYTAVADGTATITGHRSTCGEAMACTPDQSSYAVTVRVSG